MRIIIPSLIFLIAVIASPLFIKGQISKQQAIDTLYNNVLFSDTNNVNVLVFPEIIDNNIIKFESIAEMNCSFDSSWVFFIDSNPKLNWAHDCKYVFIDCWTGHNQISQHRYPPGSYWSKWESVFISEPMPEIGIPDSSLQAVNYYTYSDPKKYAILICWDEEEACRWNNLSHIYCGLKRKYGFLDDNIFVLTGDGINPSNSDLDGDLIGNDFDGPCSKDSISGTFNYLKYNMTNKDLFFFYATTHGDTVGGDTASLRLYEEPHLYDYELDQFIDSLEFSQAIIALDACYSGYLVEDLEGAHRTIQTSVDTVQSLISVGFGFHEMSFWWGTALRGYYPISKSQPWINGPSIGNHDSLYIWTSKDSTDFNPDLLIYGGNGDSIIQLSEAHNFGVEFSTDMSESGGIHNSNTGVLEGLITLNGIEGRIDTSQSISGDYLIGKKLTLNSDVILDNSGFCNIFLNDSSILDITDSSIFRPYGYYTDIVGCDGTSSILVNGELRSSYMDFTTFDGAVMVISFNNINRNYCLENFTFNNIEINGQCKSLNFNKSTFGNSSLKFKYGDLSVDSSSFNHSYISISDPYETDNKCDIYNNVFDSISDTVVQAVITIEDYSNFRIEENEIQYRTNRGIELFYAGWDEPEYHSVKNNVIAFNGFHLSTKAELGIHSYYSSVDIVGNEITGNDYGITGFHHSDINVLGDSTATIIDSTQQILDNIFGQCLFNQGSFPTEFHYNVIGSTETNEYPYIKAVEIRADNCTSTVSFAKQGAIP